MPMRSRRFCPHPGCRTLVDSGRCPPHQAMADAREAVRKVKVDALRASSTERGYDAAWRACRRQYLAAHPMCVGYGERQGMCGALAAEADHIVSVAEAPDLRLKWSNLRPLCKACHSARTASEQGFGKARATARGVP